MKVYVLKTGCYENEGIKGVYATPEAAMAAHIPRRPTGNEGVHGSEYGELAGQPWLYEWRKRKEGEGWSFDADWDDAASITVYEIDPSEEGR